MKKKSLSSMVFATMMAVMLLMTSIPVLAATAHTCANYTACGRTIHSASETHGYFNESGVLKNCRYTFAVHETVYKCRTCSKVFGYGEHDYVSHPLINNRGLYIFLR